MAWSFGDGFDLYANNSDPANNYWDSTSANWPIVAGRFAGSQALQTPPGNNIVCLAKSSGVNDAVHHIVLAFQQGNAVSGTNLGLSLQLSDGATVQCTVVFRSDGAILLLSGSAGATLATYTGAFTAASTWYAFEFEIVINNTTGSFAVRKNGNTVNDFSATGLNTRGGTANNYANKLGLVTGANGGSLTNNLDDVFWRSDASSVAWMGDIRCYTRMPASDASVQFSRFPAGATSGAASLSAFRNPSTSDSFYAPITASQNGTVATATVLIGTGFTGTLKCSVFSDASNNPGAVITSATNVTNPAAGTLTLTFPTPFAVVQGTQYWLGFSASVSAGNALSVTTGSAGRYVNSVAYAAFPTASPSIAANDSATIITWTITFSTSYGAVSEAQQDAATSYVYDSTVGHADLYGVGTIASTPASTIAVTTRAYMQKSDAGSRTAAVRLKSGATTVASPTLTLTTSGWQWAWRTDLVDPNTSAAWTAAAVNSAQIGPTVIA